MIGGPICLSAFCNTLYGELMTIAFIISDVCQG